MKKNKNFKNKLIDNISGILLIDKPYGISSNRVLQIIKKIFNLNKIGHSGTLDILATGMLALFLGKSTKFSKYIINSDKIYIVSIILGIRTDTYDYEGNVIKKKKIYLHEFEIKNALKIFNGTLNQIPPMFSSKKYKGYPLYKYARKGIKILRNCKIIKIYYIKFLYFKFNKLILKICCSKGTYIRKFVDDLGLYLNCGAYVSELRRIKISNFSYKKMFTIKDIKNLLKNKKKKYGHEIILDKLIIPINNLFKKINK
ncbi:MAG: tRNA pseudouridine(55) synthase TruB [Candidatus Makana argininalis]